jgi:hypothetical protein
VQQEVEEGARDEVVQRSGETRVQAVCRVILSASGVGVYAQREG